MSETTKIQWADATWNPWLGCTKVSAGCAHCYAENTTRARVLRSQGKETWGKGAQRSRTSGATWKVPLRWDTEVAAHPDYRTKVFPSLCDWLDDEVPIEWLADFLKLIHDTPNLDWLLLTKRPENWYGRLVEVLEHDAGFPIKDIENEEPETDFGQFVNNWTGGTPFPANIWLGTSVENQEMADKRIPELLKVPARIRFLSVEPMLGPINLIKLNLKDIARIDGIGWVIIGGESGPKARPCHVEWIRGIVNQCGVAGVSCFVKQLGSCPTSNNSDGSGMWVTRVKNKKGGDPAEWPADLRVRQFPKL